MAISTYAELQTALQNWLARSDADIVSRIPEFIALVEAQFNREIRHRRMEAQTTLTCTGGTATVALPSDYVEARSFVTDTNPKSVLTFVTPQQLATNWPAGSTGIPIEYTIIGSNMHLGPIPDSAYDITATYYQRIPALTDAAPTNWMLTYNQDAYMYGSLMQASPYLQNDERVPVWASFYKLAMDSIENDQRRSAFNGGPLTTRVAVSVR